MRDRTRYAIEAHRTRMMCRPLETVKVLAVGWVERQRNPSFSASLMGFGYRLYPSYAHKKFFQSLIGRHILQGQFFILYKLFSE
jgi:hypothetical protein